MVSIKELTLVLDGSYQNSTYCCSVCPPTVTDTICHFPSPVHVLPSTQFFLLCINSPETTAVSHPQSAPLVFPQSFPLIARLFFPACETSAALYPVPANIDSKYSDFSWLQRRRLTLSQMAGSHFLKAFHSLS